MQAGWDCTWKLVLQLTYLASKLPKNFNSKHSDAVSSGLFSSGITYKRHFSTVSLFYCPTVLLSYCHTVLLCVYVSYCPTVLLSSSCHCSWPLFTWSGTSVGSPHVNSACISIITSLMGKKRPVARKRKYAWNVWCYIRLLFCSHVKELQSIAKSSNFYFYDQYAISISTLLISIIAISIFQFPFDSEHIIMQFS